MIPFNPGDITKGFTAELRVIFLKKAGAYTGGTITLPPPPTVAPSLDFSDPNNSGYVAALGA